MLKSDFVFFLQFKIYNSNSKLIYFIKNKGKF